MTGYSSAPASSSATTDNTAQNPVTLEAAHDALANGSGGSPGVKAALAALCALARYHQVAADQAIQAQLESEWQDIAAEQASLDAEAVHRQAEIVAVKEIIAKLEATVPMVQTREQDFNELVEQGYLSGHATQGKTTEWVELERDPATQQSRLVEAQSALRESAQTQARARPMSVSASKHRKRAHSSVRFVGHKSLGCEG